jgi:DNA-nicking Smr family endonuclease
MKTDKKSQQKPKEFVNSPFKALKGVQAKPAEPEGKVAAAKPQPKIAAAEADDMELFLREVADVQRMHGAASTAGRVARPAPPIARKIDEGERRLFLQALEKLEMDVVFQDELPEDVEPLRPLPSSRLRQLKRGAIRIDYQLDLHGLTRDEAVESLACFIGGAYNRGQKGVLVITGKGNNSPGEPVLQAAVSGWLRDKGRGMVAEFAPAPRQMGGSGAFVVFLKDKDKVMAKTDMEVQSK